MKHANNYILTFLISIFMMISQSTLADNRPHPYHTDTNMQNEILYHINKYRTTHGLSRLLIDPIISREATLHSREMAAHKIPFGHSKFSQRIGRLYHQVKESTAGAENVAFNYKNAEIVVKQWILSPGHRHNILGRYNITGIGIARDERGRIYYTQIFMHVRGG